MRSFINDYKKHFSGYIINKSKRYLSKTDYQYMIGEWYRNIKENENYFEICRDLLKYREIYLSNKKIVQNASNKNDNISDFVNTNILDDQDDKYDPDIEYYPDLDELEKKKYDFLRRSQSEIPLALADWMNNREKLYMSNNWKSKNRHKYLLQYHLIFVCK